MKYLLYIFCTVTINLQLSTVASHLCSNVQFNDPIKLITIENYPWRKIDHDSDDIKLGLCSRPWMRVVGRYGLDGWYGPGVSYRYPHHHHYDVGGGGIYSYMSSVQLSDRSLLPVWMWQNVQRWSRLIWPQSTSPFLFGCCSDGELWGVMVYLCL